MHNDTAACPCGSGRPFSSCCAPVISGAIAPSAEALMRSRYSAYVTGAWAYLHESWHPDTRPSRVSPTSTAWLGLTILGSGTDTVEFIAGFRAGNRIMVLHENSRFRQVDGHWRYLDGRCEVREAPRNSPCPCGSGRKTKYCCTKKAP